jgi:hypothetical protein
MDIVSFLDWVSRVTAVIFLVTLIWGIYAWAKGILPALIRLGNGLSQRKIAIFAKGDHLTTLENLLQGSKLFSKKNVIKISAPGDFSRAEPATVFLIFWHDWQNNIPEILKWQKGNTVLIIYAPRDEGDIPVTEFNKFYSEPNVTVVNFSGRLLNDIIVSLITTSYR